jgi:hypothetical protein
MSGGPARQPDKVYGDRGQSVLYAWWSTATQNTDLEILWTR